MVKERVGVLGSGRRGMVVGCRLADQGYQVTVFDPDRCRTMHPIRPGMSTVTVPADAAEDAELVLLLLPDERAVEDAVFECGGVAETLPDGHAMVNLSCVGSDYSARTRQRCADLGLLWLESALIGEPSRDAASALCLLTEEAQGRFDHVQRVLLSVAHQVAVVPAVSDLSSLRPQLAGLTETTLLGGGVPA